MDENEDERICWVCLCGSGDAEYEHRAGEWDTTWVSPCRCVGSTRWVHQSCIQKWIDEKQRGSTLLPVRCPQCQTKYQVRMPKSSLLWTTYEVADLLFETACPIVSIGLVTSIVYMSALTYGAMAMCQFLGVKQGVGFLRNMRQSTFCLVVPLIPAALILPRLVRPSITVHRYVEPVAQSPVDPDQMHFNVVEQDVLTLDLTVDDGSSGPEASHHMSISRAVVGGLMLPPMASFMGKLCFSRMTSTVWKRSAAGGLLYLLSKHCLRWCFEQYQTQQLRQRRVLSRQPNR